MQLLFDNGDEHVGGDGTPDLRLHGVLAVAQESLDAQMLLDPFEEQLAELFKTSPGQIVGKSRESFLPEEIARQHRLNDLLVMDSGESIALEESTQEDDGKHWYLSQRFPLFNAQRKVIGICGISTDITEHKRAQTEVEHVNRALTMLSIVNHHLVHAENEATLLHSICQDVVRVHGYRMGWVGFARHDQARSIEVVARSEHENGYIDLTQLTWAETPRGDGLTGRAIRTGETQVCQDLVGDPSFLPWRDAASQRGYAASIALPLIDPDSRQAFGVINLYAAEVNAFIPSEVERLEQMAADLAYGVRALRTRSERDQAMTKIQQQFKQAQKSLEDTVRAISTIVELRDPYTAGHQKRVASLAGAIATQIGLSPKQAHVVYLAGIVHDVGKVQLPAEILSKPGKISDIELSLIKTHAQAGYEILKEIEFPWPIAQIVLQHHERLDGSGYPHGLKGDAILLEARILAVSDVVEAMCSHRPYRAGMHIDEALKEIARGSATEFDAQVVEACLTLFREKGFSFDR